jgi:hypothetical protein
MRNYITSSIANEIRRYRAAAVDMSRMVIDPVLNQWHVQLCTVVQQPVGDALQRRHGGLLTSGTSTYGIASSLFGFVGTLLKPANERLLVKTAGANGSNCQQCPSTLGSHSGSRVS